MSKFFINISNTEHGEVILNAEEHALYLFLNEDLIPTDRQIGFYQRVYNNVIHDCATLVYARLQSKRKVFKEGFAIKYDAIKATTIQRATPLDPGFCWDGIVRDYKEKITECELVMNDFENVIVLWFEEAACLDERYSHFVSTSIRCNVCKRIFVETASGSHYDYYEVPEKRDVEINYIPGVLEKISLVKQGLRVYPYSEDKLKEIHELIRSQNQATKDILEKVKSWEKLNI